ncbi:MAG: hypothetical protein WA254_03385 [Candidatus Sulfotelmatobacter sp.]
MLRYDFINKEWIVSRAARRIYRTAAVTSLALYPIMVALRVSEVPRILVPALRPVLLASIIGAGVTLVGMEFFLFRFDDSHALKQIFWFGAMLFIPLGPALYCLLVYSRSKAFAGLHQEGVGGTTA